LTGAGFRFGDELPAREIEILAEIAHTFFLDWFGAAVAALMGDAGIVTGAVQADPQIGVALMAGFTPPRQAGQPPFPAASVTMARFSHTWRMLVAILRACQNDFLPNAT
jgi:hypothetical protein